MAAYERYECYECAFRRGRRLLHVGSIEIYSRSSRALWIGVAGQLPNPERWLTLEIYLPLCMLTIAWWR